MAEGVRLYSQESWRIITDNKGVELVGQHIKHVVSDEVLRFIDNLSIFAFLLKYPDYNEPIFNILPRVH